MYLISEIVKGAFWALAAEPVLQMLGLGSIFAAWNIANKSNFSNDYFIKSESKAEYESEFFKDSSEEAEMYKEFKE